MSNAAIAFAIAALRVAFSCSTAYGQSTTLDRVKACGKLSCGVSQVVGGFSMPDGIGV